MDWTAIIAGAVSSAVNGIAVFLAVRYLGRAMDKLERNGRGKDGGHG